VSSQTVGPTYYADFGGLDGLKKGGKVDDPKTIRAAAQQFESLFTNMMLKSMREAKLGEGMGESQESDLYQDMYDQQISLKMAQGKGIGLADMLVQQLTRNSAAKASALTGAAGASGAGSSVGSAGGVSATGGTTGSGSTGTGSATTSDRISFVKALEPYAERAASQLGVSSDTLIAQAALETGWGQHVPVAGDGSSSLNLFGIKAGGSWNGDSVNALTTEYSGGSAGTVAQSFRAYSSLQQGVNDYVTLLQRSPHYQQALGTGDNVSAFGSALARGGYATDPVYVQKLQATAASVKALRSGAGTAALKILAGVPTTMTGESS
jgi:peptidoglycan hydrolase FlgJ